MGQRQGKGRFLTLARNKRILLRKRAVCLGVELDSVSQSRESSPHASMIQPSRGTVTCHGPQPHIRVAGELDSGLMAKDKSEKKKRRASDAVPAEVEEDVEMKVSSDSA